MPRISTFYGISITMYHRDHWPPHIHAEYGEHNAAVGIDPVDVIRGHLPPRAEALVREWMDQHQDELLENWERARRMDSLQRVAPLA